MNDPGLRSEFAPFNEAEKNILNLEPEPLDRPWPARGGVYDAIVAVSTQHNGLFVDGDTLVKIWVSEVTDDLEEMTDIPLLKTAPGVYKAKLKYWATSQYLYGSGETEFEDGFEVTEMVKVDL